jgi:membrane protein implicated in regulation of membrane protease activity
MEVLFMASPELVWFIIGLVFLIAEIFMPGLVIIFFGVGAWVTAVCAMAFDLSFNMQLIIFMISSILGLFLLRKSLNRIFQRGNPQVDDLSEEFIGKTAVVELPINLNRQGKVVFRGTEWTAVADQDIEKGKVVKILSKDSIVLKVEELGKV